MMEDNEHSNRRAYADYLATHGKSYDTLDEWEQRIEIYEANDRFIREWNASQTETQLGHNKFSDWADHEFHNSLLTSNRSQSAHQTSIDEPVKLSIDRDIVEGSVDWRETDAVGPVKNQGGCGSCWAFATAATLEAALYFDSGTYTALSEQQMVDCAGESYGDYGCNGGLPAFAMLYSDAQPLMSEEDYPYAEVDQECVYEEDKGLISAGGFTLVEEQNPYQMQAAAELGPFTVAVDAGSLVFRFYRSGVFNHADKCGSSLNHAITVVGYSNKADDELPYWIVRNSWGNDWGEEGYIRMAITDGVGMCGINIEPTLPNIYYMSVFDSVTFLVLTIVGLVLSIWPILRLGICKNEELLFLHEGQKGLIKLSYVMFVVYFVTVILFGVSLGPPPLMTWIFYRTGVFMMYAAVHILLCLLHYQMGVLERSQAKHLHEGGGFGKVKTAILACIAFVLSLTGFCLLLAENKGVASYSDEDELKFDRRHSVQQMRNMMLSLKIGCILLNIFFTRNLAQMVSRPNRAKGTTSWVHYTALACAILAIVSLIGMTVALYFPTEIQIYRYLQDFYFFIQVGPQVALLTGAIIQQTVTGQFRRALSDGNTAYVGSPQVSPRPRGDQVGLLTSATTADKYYESNQFQNEKLYSP